MRAWLFTDATVSQEFHIICNSKQIRKIRMCRSLIYEIPAICSSLIQRISGWFTESFLVKTEILLFCSVDQCLRQWIILFMTEIRFHLVQWITAVVPDSLRSFSMNQWIISEVNDSHLSCSMNQWIISVVTDSLLSCSADQLLIRWIFLVKTEHLLALVQQISAWVSDLNESMVWVGDFPCFSAGNRTPCWAGCGKKKAF